MKLQFLAYLVIVIQLLECCRGNGNTTTTRKSNHTVAVKKFRSDDKGLPAKFQLNTSFTQNTTDPSPTKLQKKIKLISNVAESTDYLLCPKETEAPFQLFPTLCHSNQDCKRAGENHLCCKVFGNKRCIEGKVNPPKEPPHEPILFVIPRKCPAENLAETWWSIQICETDRDCWPRVCCPDGRYKYCRTSQPQLEEAPLAAARQLASPLESISQYLQCTKPPPPVFDIHPKPCNNTLDCFPNLCCAEAGKRHCRPPKRSLLSLLTGFGTRFANISFIRDWADNLVIR